jgi:hypothetical protein
LTGDSNNATYWEVGVEDLIFSYLQVVQKLRFPINPDVALGKHDSAALFV